jgi:hypothetical protein
MARLQSNLSEELPKNRSRFRDAPLQDFFNTAKEKAARREEDRLLLQPVMTDWGQLHYRYRPLMLPHVAALLVVAGSAWMIKS